MSTIANGRQEIPPYDDKRYSDIFWASLYGSLCSLAVMEIRVIWLRSSVLLLVQVVVLRLAYDAATAPSGSQSLIHILPGAFGLALALLWYALNYHGWKNQNVWFWHAARLRFTQVTAPLPSDAWSDQVPPEPWGAIYGLAQLLVGGELGSDFYDSTVQQEGRRKEKRHSEFFSLTCRFRPIAKIVC